MIQDMIHNESEKQRNIKTIEDGLIDLQISSYRVQLWNIRPFRSRSCDDFPPGYSAYALMNADSVWIHKGQRHEL